MDEALDMVKNVSIYVVDVRMDVVIMSGTAVCH
jgi:hypothetical protein